MDHGEKENWLREKGRGGEKRTREGKRSHLSSPGPCVKSKTVAKKLRELEGVATSVLWGL